MVVTNDSNNKLNQGFRLAAYWLTLAAFLLAWTWYPFDAIEKGKEIYLDKVGEALLPAHLDEVGVRPSRISRHTILVMPVLFVATLAALLITNTPLPTTDWLIRPMASLRTFPISLHAEEGRSIYIKAKNQFLKGPNTGQLNFHLVAILFIVIPSILQFVGRAHFRLTTRYKTEGERWWYIALLFGWAGLIGLAFFLIPVTRHSVLLAAMGWSPVHALRIHVVAGWFAWWCIVIHALMYVIDWFRYHGDEVLDVIFPPPKCWTWKKPYDAFAGGEDEFDDTCVYPFFNFTGMIAGSFFCVLAASSIHWFRRRHYRIFYLLHVTFGSLMLIAVMFHWPGATTILMPSLIYYMASTSPTLNQALVSYRRGGHQIVKVIDLGPNGGNCMEVHVATDATTDAALAREPCSYIKLCVPAISVVWHPFTVFRSFGGKEQDETPQTMRILFRPVGSFTAQLARQLVASPRPIAIFDGLYSVGNHATRAMTHDHVVIVAGGVAISPFLSLIPNLLERLRVAAEDQGTAVTAVMTKKIVLHWSCREESLIRYVRDTYLYPMLVRANQNNNNIVTFQVHIYRTGSVPPGHVAGQVSMDDSVIETPVVEDIAKAVEIIEETVTTTLETDEIMVDDDNSYTEKEEETVLVKAYVTSADVNGSLSSTGFAMELARMMPGRYNSVWQNLPLFAALSVMFWSGQWIYFHFDVVQIAQAHYNSYLGAWISNLIWLAVVLFLSSSIERVAQWYARRYPTRMGDDPYVVSSSPVDEELARSTKDDDMMKKGESSVVVHYEEHVGRPVIQELLDEPRRVATAPAIFVCGPVALTDALRRAAQTEDAFGLVRFVLYEELFEM